MIEQQLSSFIQVALHYFEKLTAKGASARPPVIRFGDPILLEYTGVIRISGMAEGCVYITANKPVLSALLTSLGETSNGDAELRDLIGEMASTIASNVRRDFGHNFKVSTPNVLANSSDQPEDLPPATFAIPVEWRGHELFVVIGLTEQNGHA